MPIIIIGLVIAFIVWRVTTHKNNKIVLEHSQRIKALLDLNETIHYRSVKSHYPLEISCQTKRQFDLLDFDEYLISEISQHEIHYRSILESVSFNHDEYWRYVNEVQEIASTATEEYCQSFGFSLTKFQKYEERLFKRKQLRKPQLNVVMICKATYTSPQSRNHYSKSTRYEYYNLKSFLDEVMERKAEQETRQYHIKRERSKMTNSLRYDILERDGFRCQICGSTAQDGVKLHIDHIIPVSKGGETIPSNLRTLCDRCNLGKSDKM